MVSETRVSRERAPDRLSSADACPPMVIESAIDAATTAPAPAQISPVGRLRAALSRLATAAA